MTAYFEVLFTENGVHFLSEPESGFEETYLQARRREGWLYADEQVRALPDIAEKDRHASIWRLRRRSFESFTEYMQTKSPAPRFMIEIGCGNGWFSHRLAEGLRETKIFGLDINQHELLQASRVFGNANPSWLFGNLFKINWPERLFDIVIFNGSLQYFPNLAALFDRILPSLAVGGEIHILDSPFYSPDQLPSVQKHTEWYYRQLGVPAMVSHYHSHTMAELAPYGLQCLYDPGSMANRLKRLVGIGINPMPWIQLRPIPEHP